MIDWVVYCVSCIFGFPVEHQTVEFALGGMKELGNISFAWLCPAFSNFNR